MASSSLEAALASALQGFGSVRLAAPIVLGKTVEPEELAGSAKLGQSDFFGLARSEAHCGSGGNIEVHAEAFFPVEIESLVGFKEVIVAADLNGTITGVHDFERCLASTGVELDVSVIGNDLSRNHLVFRAAVLAGANGIMDSHQLGPVWKRPFDLDHWHEVRDAGHDVVSGQECRSPGNEIGNRASLARAFQDLIGNVRDSLWIVH